MGSYTDLPRSHGGVEKHRVCERGSRLLRVDRNGGGKQRHWTRGWQRWSSQRCSWHSDGAGSDGELAGDGAGGDGAGGDGIGSDGTGSDGTGSDGELAGDGAGDHASWGMIMGRSGGQRRTESLMKKCDEIFMLDNGYF